MKLFEYILSDQKRSRWFVVALCFALGLLAGWLISDSGMVREAVLDF